MRKLYTFTLWLTMAVQIPVLTPVQALARMGASVTGIEPQQDNIKAAVAHARGDALVAARTNYLACTAEELAASGTVSLQISIIILFSNIYLIHLVVLIIKIFNMRSSMS